MGPDFAGVTQGWQDQWSQKSKCLQTLQQKPWLFFVTHFIPCLTKGSDLIFQLFPDSFRNRLAGVMIENVGKFKTEKVFEKNIEPQLLFVWLCLYEVIFFCF